MTRPRQKSIQYEAISLDDTMASFSIEEERENNGNRKFRWIALVALLITVITIAAVKGSSGSSVIGDDVSKVKATDSTKVEATPERESDSATHNTDINSAAATDPDDHNWWPDLVGKTGPEAEASLKKVYGDRYEIQLIEKDSFFTEDYRINRIRLFLDENEKVERTPEIG